MLTNDINGALDTMGEEGLLDENVYLIWTKMCIL